MIQQEIVANGTINKDGKLSMYMGEVNEFFKAHKNYRIVARFMVAPARSSEALKGYYFNYVVPKFKQALYEAGERKTEEQTELYMREISPIMHDEQVDITTGEYISQLKKINQLSNAQLIEHIETIKQIAAEDYFTFIEDPKTI